jgi:hypothetical protein
MKKPGSGTSAEGRTPPPPEKRFPKGRSGNPAGRPKGAISVSLLTRKVALKKHRVPIDGKTRSITLLELLILKAQAMAASGHPGAAAQINWLRTQTEQSDADLAIGGFLLAPAPLTLEEFIAKEDARSAGKVEPGTEIDVESEEFLKAVRREPSPLGEALQAFHKKYSIDSPTTPALK